MSRKVDSEIFVGFIEEAKSYLPEILRGIEAYGADPACVEALELAHRHAHTIKGAAALVGLTTLSHMADHLESTLEELATYPATPSPETLPLLRSVVTQIETLLDGLVRDVSKDAPLLEEVARACRRLRGLPEPDAVDALGDDEHASGPPPSDDAPCRPVCSSGFSRGAPAEAGTTNAGESVDVPDFDALNADSMPPAYISDDDDAPDFGVHQSLPGDSRLGSSKTLSEDASPELIEVFALEAEDHLRTISTALPALEQHPDNKDHLQDIRRSAHTLKGAAAMVGFENITRLAHRMEDLLDLLYDGDRPVTPEVIQLLFASTDALEDMAAGENDPDKLQGLYDRFALQLASAPDQEIASVVPDQGNETVSPDVGEEVAIRSVTSPLEGEAAPAEPAPAGIAEIFAETGGLDLLGSLPLPPAAMAPAPVAPAETVAPRRRGQLVRVPIERLDDLVKLVGELVITRTEFEQRMSEFARQVEELHPSTERLRKIAYSVETQYEASALGAGRRPVVPLPATGSRLEDGGRIKAPNSSYFISPASFPKHGFDDLQFDRYTEFHLLSRELSETTNDVQAVGGELNQLLGDLDTCLNRHARIATEIEDKLRRLRMVPLATLANKLYRTVRNVADPQGKQVDLVLEGEHTQLDKTVLEEMSDPLMHLLRNAVDHGVEPPELRQAQAKPVKGTIRLSACYEGNQAVIRINDDGAGIDPRILRSTAVHRGFVTGADADALSDEDLYALLFLPGFSTAHEVSEVSGRGVGLDIVKSQVHKLKGTLAVESTPGQGTTFTVRLPMTLAITRALLVRANQETFALPLDSVRQILRVEREDMERVGQEAVVRVGGHVFPMVFLAKVLNLKQAADATVVRPPVLIVNTGAKQVALVVDHVLGGREIVIKNLGTHLREVHGVSGATLMGDGGVVLILNPAEMGRESAPLKTLPRPSAGRGVADPAHLGRGADVLTIMVADDSTSVRRVVSNIIKGAGWKAIAAKDGMEALEILHSIAPPDLILLDVEMPRMDGYELLSTLRAQDAYRNLPVIMVTSRASEKHRRRALDLGASGYVVKPFQDEALLNVIRHLVRQSRQAAMT
jgi:chemosensory pili system protein ChpA (sensor histidine kinase/response regulator)